MIGASCLDCRINKAQQAQLLAKDTEIAQLKERIRRLEEEISKPRARREHPDTSHEAAARLDPTEVEMKILRLVRSHPAGLTVEQIVQMSGDNMIESTVSGRMRALCRKGFVREAPDRRISSRNRARIVWLPS